MGVVATLAALVLGLLVASTKNAYDAREIEINPITAYVILLDNLLAKYERRTFKPREPRYARQFQPWSKKFGAKRNIWVQSTPFKAAAEGEAVYQRIQELQPSTDIQRQLKERIIQVTNDLACNRELPALFTSRQFDTGSLFGSAIALDDNLVRWLFSYGACKRHNLGVACHLCAVRLRGNLPYS